MGTPTYQFWIFEKNLTTKHKTKGNCIHTFTQDETTQMFKGMEIGDQYIIAENPKMSIEIWRIK